MVEAEGLRTVRVFREDGNPRAPQPVEMPFPEMSGCVSSLLHCLWESLLLLPQAIPMVKHTCPVMSASSENRGPCRGTHGPSRIKAIEAEPLGSHVVQVGCLEDRVLVIASLAPSLVIGHYQNEIGFVLCPVC